MKDLSIVLSGEAGQGIQTVEQFLTRVLKLSGFNVFATKEYMSRIRGGANSTEIRVSSRRVSACVERIDLLIPLGRGALKHVEHRITPETLIIGDGENLAGKTGENVIGVPLSRIASELGGDVFANIVAAGIISGVLGVDSRVIDDYLKERFAEKGESVIGNNMTAAAKGYRMGRELIESGKITVDVDKDAGVKEEILLNGAEAVALGALAGGCNFISSYPMSPSTAVLIFLAGHAADFGIIVEQAEDEIAAINMALGAWYAGARGMVTTSGGGFALMTEGLSLAAMIESPMVIHLAQRPGPATGLPTRTEQGDLQLALYAGHGEFPRIILAPGRIEEAFSLTRKAFDLADRFQVPVILLTDQYFIDSYYNLPGIGLNDPDLENHVVSTKAGYRRFELVPGGISPRGIPGYGEGLVVVDSDEHDEAGHITEDLALRVKMVDKRLNKLEAFLGASIPPALIGKENFQTLILSWGSTRPIIEEALERLGRDDLACLHFSQVYPLPPETRSYLEKAQRTIIIENNATSQFGQVIKSGTGKDMDHRILKYNGLPFFVEELTRKLTDILNE